MPLPHDARLTFDYTLSDAPAVHRTGSFAHFSGAFPVSPFDIVSQLQVRIRDSNGFTETFVLETPAASAFRGESVHQFMPSSTWVTGLVPGTDHTELIEWHLSAPSFPSPGEYVSATYLASTIAAGYARFWADVNEYYADATAWYTYVDTRPITRADFFRETDGLVAQITSNTPILLKDFDVAELLQQGPALRLTGSFFDDELQGGARDDHLDGNSGNDTLFYSGGLDFFDGSLGTDTVDLSAFAPAVLIDLSAADMQALTMDLPVLNGGEVRQLADIVSVENVITGSGDDFLRGDGYNNNLHAGAGNDWLAYSDNFPALGWDLLNGGTGIDTADFSEFWSAVWISLHDGGIDAWTRDQSTLDLGDWRAISELSGIEDIVGTRGDDYLQGDAADNTLTGGAGDDRLLGGGGDDTLVYHGGVDRLDGGSAVDTADFSWFASAIWVDLAYTPMEVWTRNSANLSSGIWNGITDLQSVEYVIGTSFSDELHGNGLDNVLAYTGGNDLLDGAGGADTVDFSHFGAAVWVDLAYDAMEGWTRDSANLSTGSWREISNLRSVENLVDTSFSDEIHGNAANNVLAYTGGQDLLDGAAGVDTVDFSRFGAAVWVDLGYAAMEGWTRDTANLASGSWRGITDLQNVESLIGTAFSDELHGDSSNNALAYTGGTDLLDGAGGIDTVDFSRFGSAVWVDLASAAMEGWTRDSANLVTGDWRGITDLLGVENLIDTAFSDELHGNATSNMLTYTGGTDLLDGAGGTDTVDFSRFGSAVWVDLGYAPMEGWTRDAANLASGDWRGITDLQGMENVTGSEFADELHGDTGANVIDGRGGNDLLTGGAGSDRFHYSSIDDGTDAITDFARGGGGDVLDVRDVLVGYVPGSSNAANFLNFVQSGSNTTMSVNADGIGSDFVLLATLTGVTGVVLNDMLAQGNLVLA